MKRKERNHDFMKTRIAKGLANSVAPLLIAITLLGGNARAQWGGALNVNGVSGYVTAADSASLDLGSGVSTSFTIEAFFYVPDYNGNGFQTLIHKDLAYDLSISFSTINLDRVMFRSWFPGGGSLLLSASQEVSIGWHHVAAIFNQGTRSIFFDGYLIATTSYPLGVNNSAGLLNIGASVSTNIFNGSIDEVRFSDTVRYSGSTYSVPTAPFSTDPNTRALWHFDEGTGSKNFVDASGNGNTAGNGSTSGTTPIPLAMQKIKNQLVLTWTNASFSLQSAAAANGPFATISDATSPYTNTITSGQKFFRLVSN